MATKVGAPVVGLIDCAGLRLQEGTDALTAFGRIYKKSAVASGVIPQITAVFGNCGGGAAGNFADCRTESAGPLCGVDEERP